MKKSKMNIKKEKNLFSNKLSKKGLMGLSLAGLMIFNPFLLTGCSGKQGPKGNDGANGTTWYYGVEYSENQGVVGDFFYDTDDYNIYKKTDAGWVFLSNIKGPQGETGPEGPDGKDGTRWFTGTEITGTELSITATITGAVIGDLYLNIDTANVYKCVEKDTWQYLTSFATQTIPPNSDNDNDDNDDVITTGQIDLTSQFEWTANQTISSVTQGSTYVLGQPCSSQNFKCSDFIDVSNYVGRTIKITVPVYCTSANRQATMAVCAYNLSQEYLATLKQFTKAPDTNSNTAEYFEFEVLEGYTYIRTAWYNDNYNNYSFEDDFSCVVLPVEVNE